MSPADFDVVGDALARHRDEAKAELDRVDRMKPGSGRVDLFGFGRGTFGSGVAGGGVDYEHRLTRGWSAFARGELGYGWGESRGGQWKALGGLRWTF